ncbi:MAG: ABC transporter substrate-binding protein [Methanomassiliicoccales archaeon]|nr:ABC transporter substrate-binding protein [Methanomassiliicoccales archaeon]
MEKKLAIIAVIVVAIVVVGAVAITVMPGGDDDSKTIYWSTVAPVNQKAAIANGTISAGVSWEPYVSDSILAGSGSALIWSGDIWSGHPCCVLAVDTDYAEDNPEAVATYIAALIVATEWLTDTIENPESENYSLLLEIGAQFSGRSEEVVNASLAHIKYDTLIDEATLSWFVNYTESYQELDLFTTSLSARGYDNATDFVDQLVNQTYYEMAIELLESNPTETYNIRVGYLAGDLHQFARVVASNATVGNGTTIFEQFGITVTSPNLAGYPSGGDVMDAFAGNYIDIGYLGAPPTLLKAINANVDVTIVALVNTEGSAIVVGDGISSFEDLAGKTVGVPGPSSIQYLLLLYYADQQGYNVVAA